MPTIVIEKPFAGWVPDPTGATSLDAAYVGNGKGYSRSSGISLNRFQRLGDIAPGETYSVLDDSTPYVNQLPLNFAMASTGNAFGILKNARLVVIDVANLSGVTGQYTLTFAGTHAGHTATTGFNHDAITVKDFDTTPVEWILWAYEDSTDGDIAIIKPDGSGADYDWFSSLSGSGVLSKGVPLKMIQGPDGDVYCTNGEYLARASITGAMGSATGNRRRIFLGPGREAQGICNYQDQVVTIAHKSNVYGSALARSDIRVYFYDTYSPNFRSWADIPDNFAHGVFFDGRNLFAVTSGRNNTLKYWQYNGAGFEVVFETALISTANNNLHGTFESARGGFLLGIGGSIYSRAYGGFHNDTIVTNDGASVALAIGALKNLKAGLLFVGVQDASSNYKIYYSNTSGYYRNADFRTELYTLPQNGNITDIRIFFSQFGTGASIQVSLFKNYAALSIGGGSDQLNKTIDNSTYGAISSFHINDRAIFDVDNFYMNFRFNHASATNTAAIIRRVEIDWTPSQ